MKDSLTPEEVFNVIEEWYVVYEGKMSFKRFIKEKFPQYSPQQLLEVLHQSQRKKEQ